MMPAQNPGNESSPLRMQTTSDIRRIRMRCKKTHGTGFAGVPTPVSSLRSSVSLGCPSAASGWGCGAREWSDGHVSPW